MTHLKSSKIDEKIGYLDKEMKKMGVDLAEIANSTSGLYSTTEIIPAVPESPAEYTDVPDPNGVRSDGWTQPSNGFDASDPNTWENAYNDFSWMYNSNEVAGETDRPVLDSIDVDWTGGEAGAGIMLSHTGWGQSLGYLGNDGVYQPLITAGSTSYSMIPPIKRGSHFDGAHYTYSIPDDKWAQMQSIYAKMEAMYAAGNVATQTIKVWYGWSYFFNGNWETVGYPKKDTGSGKFILINATLFKKAGDYMSKPHENEIPGRTVMLTQHSLDDPNYYPGNPNGFMDFLRNVLDVGEKAFDWLMDLLDDGEEIAGGLPYGTPGADDPFSHDDDDDDLLDDSDFDPNEWDWAGNNADGDVAWGKPKGPPPTDEKLGRASDMNVINWYNSGGDTGSKPEGWSDQDVRDYLDNRGQGFPQQSSSGSGDTQVAASPNSPDPVKPGDVPTVPSSPYLPGKSPYKLAGLRPDGSQGLDSLGSYNYGHDGTLYQLRKTKDGKGWIPIKQAKNKGNTQVAHYVPQGELIKEGWESPKHTYIDKNQQKRWFKEKDVAPVYPKKAPPKMMNGYHPDLLPKLGTEDTPIPQIKVRKKDLLRNHNLRKDDVQKFIDLVDRLNDYIKRNPEHLAYARERYPKSDPRLAALNYKMDMQIAAADEYVEKHFPENKRLLNKVLKATKQSIKLTDPKTFKSEKGVFTTFNKLERARHFDNEYKPKERKVIKKRRGKSASRFFSKPKKRSKYDILKDKMVVLDKEMKKMMPDT